MQPLVGTPFAYRPSVKLFRSRSVVSNCTGFLVAFLAAESALAVPPIPSPPTDASRESVEVVVTSMEPNPLTVVFYPSIDGRIETAVAGCETPCSVKVPRGRYFVRVGPHENPTSDDTMLTITGPSRLAIARSDAGERVAGVAMGVVGPLILLTGLLVIAVRGFPPTTTQCSETTECPAKPLPSAAPGIGIAIAGGVLTILGWTLFDLGHETPVDLKPLSEARPVTTSFGLVPVRGGIGLGGGFRF
jgi:hypothetical protein